MGLIIAGPARSGRFRWLGGDRAAREPRRSAAGVCFEAGIEIPEHCGFSAAERKLLVSALKLTRARGATTTSAGRLFDAWASLAGVLHHSAYEAEAAMRFEDLADADETAAFEVSLVHEPDGQGRPTARLDWRPWVGETVRLLKRGCPPGFDLGLLSQWPGPRRLEGGPVGRSGNGGADRRLLSEPASRRTRPSGCWSKPASGY